MFRFEHPYLFLALALLPVLGILYLGVLRWKKIVSRKIGDPELVLLLIRNFSPRRYLVKFILAALALVFLVIAAANPQTKGKSGPISRKGLDLMIVLDVSKSMLAQDIKPNRLERSRQLVSLIIDQLSENRIGLIWFAGRAYLQMPLTTDASAAKMYLQNASPDAVPTQGTVIGEALKMAGAAFNSQEKKYKAVILVSDGEDHDPEALKMAKSLAASGVMINTVGVGSPEGATIFDPSTQDTKRDASGNTVISKLNEPQLRDLAQTGNGVYVYLQDPAAAVATLRTQLATIGQKQLEDESFVQYNTYYFYALAIVLLLLLAEIFLPERKPMPA
ncbi:vWA domain-containing protein [Flavihumibacter profundi]|uniref:vWA domain-containing protein n=1 Tax=Flavihumibacter profundi TaxID=2716883 RepID=UPI001CC33BF6|nr:VWA domain-containing protein [Flavihumibacter profundi]MBZ5857946.1 VWA domain-containing protein [Flavihumibacter profundi]